MALVLLAALGLRWPMLAFPFFADDYLFLDQMRGHSLVSAWALHDPLRNYWRPLSRQGYFSLVSLLGESPTVAHVINVVLFLAIVLLVFLVARRISGPRAGLVAASIVALHETADVPVLWASGSQDLLAVAGGLGALCLALHGRMRWAALAFLAGLLSKETVGVTPAVALWMLRAPGESWRTSVRRVAPLLVTMAAWLPLWAFMMRGGERSGLQFTLGSIPAALVHLIQAFLGAQWDPSTASSAFLVVPAIAPVVLVWTAIVVESRSRRRDSAAPASPARGVAIGLAWALLAALPVAIVAHVWSSYFYLFAVCGLALAVGAWTSRAPWPAVLLTVAALAWGSEHSRRLESFATKPNVWATQSHLSRFYFDRSMRWVSRYLEDLRRQLPSVPHHSTLFFSGIPAFASWQAGDGSLVRWVYRDSTIHSYFFADFSLEKARRGEVFVFTARNDSLVGELDRVGGLRFLASGQFLAERFDTAHDAIARALELAPDDRALHYWRGWLRFARGDSSGLASDLAAAGCAARAGPTEEVVLARKRMEVGDAQGALDLLMRGVSLHALDPDVHHRCAELLLRLSPQSGGTGMEALAARLLAPDDPDVWRTWARAQVVTSHTAEAYSSLARYFRLAGRAAENDTASVQLLKALRQGLPGGSLAQQELRRRPGQR